ncbi:hypothetical protein GCM10010451_59830 [Streptomyces virens]|uniref:Uncharacterized protein n=1 Tax=Streptomyces virens TaxID=285572 RepID=A0ABP6Q2D1_9ACTN
MRRPGDRRAAAGTAHATPGTRRIRDARKPQQTCGSRCPPDERRRNRRAAADDGRAAAGTAHATPGTRHIRDARRPAQEAGSRDRRAAAGARPTNGAETGVRRPDDRRAAAGTAHATPGTRHIRDARRPAVHGGRDGRARAGADVRAATGRWRPVGSARGTGGQRPDFSSAFSALSSAAAKPFAHSWFTRDRSVAFG